MQAVYGNTDLRDDPSLSAQFAETIGGVTVHVSHGHELGSPAPSGLLARYDAQVIVYGHTHRPLVVEADGRLVVNPGAAGRGASTSRRASRASRSVTAGPRWTS